MCSVPRERSPSNSEADTPIIARRLRSRYARSSVARTKPPTYLFNHQRFQRARDEKPDWCAIFFGAARLVLISVVVPPPAPSGPLWRSHWHLSAAGEGLCTSRDGGPQVLFSGKMTFFSERPVFTQNLGVRAVLEPISGVFRQDSYPAGRG